ncbi:MAG: hypothetical protein PVG45_02050 [Gammaproteobacteria bacterium]
MSDTWSAAVFTVCTEHALMDHPLYHAITIPNLRKVLQKTDHEAIFLLIAGTCTPYTPDSLRGGRGEPCPVCCYCSLAVCHIFAFFFYVIPGGVPA